MDSDHAQVSLFTRLVLKAVAGVVMLCSAPVVMLLWALKTIFYVLTWPIRIPWRLAMWCLGVATALLEEYRHFFLYLTCAITLGTATGILVALFTDLVVASLAWFLPFLRPRPRPQAPPTPTTTTTTTAASSSSPAKPRRPTPRHVASALYWSSDEEGPDEQEKATMMFVPPSRCHGLSAGKLPAPAPASGLPSTTATTSSATTSPSSSPSSARASRHSRAQQPGKVRVAVADTIHEESSMSEHE